MNGTERNTLVLLGAYVGTLAVVYRVDEPAVWLAWAAVAVVVTGAAMVRANRPRGES